MKPGRLHVGLLLGLLWLYPTAGYVQGVTTRVTPAIGQPVYNALAEAQRLVAAGDAGAALALLEGLRERRRLTPYELAQSWNYTAYIELQREAYADAIAAYQEVLGQREIPDSLMHGTLRTLAQLHATLGQYARAIDRLREYEDGGGVLDRELHLLLGQAHYELSRFDAALPHVEKAVAMSRDAGEPPRENELLLLQAIHHQRDDLERLEAVSRELVTHYPSSRHLRTLAGVYSRRGETRKLLAIMETLHDEGGLVSEADLRNLANLYLLHGTPAKSARLLEREQATGRLPVDRATLQLLAQAWVQAREPRRAIEPLQRILEGGGDAGVALRLARLHIDLEQWDAAVAVLETALARDDLERPDKARLMLGSAEVNRGRYAAARRAFVAAREDARSRATAERWLAYLDEELRRRQILEAAVGAGKRGS